MPNLRLLAWALIRALGTGCSNKTAAVLDEVGSLEGSLTFSHCFPISPSLLFFNSVSVPVVLSLSLYVAC